MLGKRTKRENAQEAPLRWTLVSGDRGVKGRDLHPVFLRDSLCSPARVRSASCWLLWMPSTRVLGEIRWAPWNLAMDPHHFLFMMQLPRMEQDRLCVTETVVHTNQGGPRLSQVLPRGSAVVAGTLGQHRLATHVNQSHTVLSRPYMVDTMPGPGEPAGIMADMARPWGLGSSWWTDK